MSADPGVATLREEAERRDRWLQERLDTVVPRVMERAGVDAWVVAGREYNEDPVLATMLPATWLSARRRTVLVFTDRGRRRAAVARYAVGEAFPAAWDPEREPDQWAAVAARLVEADPGRIALHRSPTTAVADGLTASEHDALMAALPGPLRERVVPGDTLAVGWLETRTPGEMEHYPEACRIAHRVLREGFEAVRPGETTTADLEWWLRERVRALGLAVWFQPTASVQRRGGPGRGSFSAPPGDEVVLPGDLVHVDFGIVSHGLHTDQQQHAYVLRPGDGGVPAGLLDGMAAANRLQDLLLAEFAVGRTGNEVLAAAREAALAEGIEPSIYSHPIGLHGHGAGPAIGLWDAQDGVPGAGDLPIHADTVWSIELNAAVAVPEWDGQVVRCMLEEEAHFDGERVAWLDGRQVEPWPIG